MATKDKSHDQDKVSAARRAPQQKGQTSNEHGRPANQTRALQRAASAPPSALRPGDVLSLQRTYGNRAVRSLLTGHTQASQSPASQGRQPIQAKLTVGAAGDQHEQEADRIARQVLSMDARPSGHAIQRASESDVDELQRKPAAIPITPLVQRDSKSEDEEVQKSPIQRQATSEPLAVGPVVDNAIARARGGGQPLPAPLRVRMERAFAVDFSGVRVHTGPEADNLNRSLQARAFTTGQDLFFKRGEYNPDSPVGQELIAHELTHVVQQRGGAAEGQVKTSPVQRMSSDNVIQRVTSLDGPFDDAYAEALLTDSQGRTAQTKAGHALDHLSVDAARIKVKHNKAQLVVDTSKKRVEALSKVYNERKVATFYVARADMKTILVNFLNDGTVKAELAKMKAGGTTEYNLDFKHAQINVVEVAPTSMIAVMPKKSANSFILIQSTKDATPQLHLQTMYARDVK